MPHDLSNDADLSLPDGWLAPSTFVTGEGRPRCIGVEIEFAAVGCDQAAAIVQNLWGGRITSDSRFRLKVAETRLGDFEVELDNHYAHPDQPDAQTTKAKIDSWVSDMIGVLSKGFVPVEIVSPPIKLTQLPETDRLITELRDAKAEDTTASAIYGFGLHLNPEAPSLTADSLRAHLQSYVLLDDWLRDQIDLDMTRRLLPFADRFPERYKKTILAADYAPDMGGLISDYLDDNATRNRELDLLPLFAHVAEEAVRARVDMTLVKPRPTYHYRLPDCRLADPSWSIKLEWNRWVMVERLAAADEDRARLASLFGSGGFMAARDRWIEAQEE